MSAARPSRLYYGWILVAALALTETVSYGVLGYVFPVFLAPMERELGWSRTATTGAFSLALLISGVAAIPVGRWVDRYGPRLLMAAGSCAAALLVLAWAFVERLTTFYLIWMGLGAVMAAVLYEPAFAVVATWFVRYRGRALTLLTFIAGFASVIFLPLAQWLVTRLGWRHALVVLAVILAVTTIPPHALLLRRRPADLGLVPDGTPEAADAPAAARAAGPWTAPMRQVLRSRSFLSLAVAFTCGSFAMSATFVHAIPYLIERGHAPGFAAAAMGLVGVMALPGRLVFTPLGSRWRRGRVTASIFVLQALSFLVLLGAGGTAGVWLFIVLFGTGFGAATPARAAHVAELYGATAFGRISGMLALVVALGRAAGPVGASALAASGGYATMLLTLAGLSGMAALAILPVDGPSGRLAQLPFEERS